MTEPKTIIDRLRELIALECKADALGEHGVEVGKALAQETTAIRALIPTAILGHHDRMRARGKKSVAAARNGVCGACHLKLPISHAISLNPEQDIEVCDNCGVFLFVEPATEEKSTFSSFSRRATAPRKTKAAKA
jgi:predicted  nucleic acid-binding Zn-ribbon protein